LSFFVSHEGKLMVDRRWLMGFVVILFLILFYSAASFFALFFPPTLIDLIFSRVNLRR